MKAHLKSSQAPITLGTDQVANCGFTVRNAVAVYFWDSQLLGEAAEIPLRVCLPCWADKNRGRYTYGIVNGEESKHAEVSA